MSDMIYKVVPNGWKAYDGEQNFLSATKEKISFSDGRFFYLYKTICRHTHLRGNFNEPIMGVSRFRLEYLPTELCLIEPYEGSIEITRDINAIHSCG